MPSGRYLLHDLHDGGHVATEHFRCAPGPAGWRYTSRITTPSGEPDGSVDLTTDQLSRPVRLELRGGHWQVRGTCLDGLTWVRAGADGTGAAEHNAPARAFTGASPCFLVATAGLLRKAPTPAPTRIRLVAFAWPVLAARTVDQLWALTDSQAHATDNGPLTVETYQVTDLETGEAGEVHLAGDIVLAAPGVELDSLEGPPNRS